MKQESLFDFNDYTNFKDTEEFKAIARKRAKECYQIAKKMTLERPPNQDMKLWRDSLKAEIAKISKQFDDEITILKMYKNSENLHKQQKELEKIYEK